MKSLELLALRNLSLSKHTRHYRCLMDFVIQCCFCSGVLICSARRNLARISYKFCTKQL